MDRTSRENTRAEREARELFHIAEEKLVYVFRMF